MLATVALGYAGGIPRSLSNKGIARAGVRPRVLRGPRLDGHDHTGCERNCRASKREMWWNCWAIHVPLEELAALAGTNAYEILTGLGCRAIMWMPLDACREKGRGRKPGDRLK